VPPRGYKGYNVRVEVAERLDRLVREWGVDVSEAIRRLLDSYEKCRAPEASPQPETKEALEEIKERLDYLEEKLNRVLELLGDVGEEVGFASEATTKPEVKPQEQKPSPNPSPSSTNPSSSKRGRFDPEEFLRRVEEAGGLEFNVKPKRLNPRDLFIVLSDDNIPPEKAREVLGG